MKKGAFIIIIIVIAAIGGYFYSSGNSSDTNSNSNQAIEETIVQEESSDGYSPDQQTLIDTFGPPPRFAISYMPIGEGEDTFFARAETWSYPSHQYEVLFLGGDIMEAYEIDPDPADTTYSSLTPNLFEYDMDYDDVVFELAFMDVEPNDWLPEFHEEGVVQSYIATYATFTMENGSLSYFETLGLPPYEGE